MPPVTLLRRSYIVDDETELQGKGSNTGDNDEVGVTRLLCMTWSFHDPASHESCIVAFYLLRSLYVPLADMNNAKTTSDSNTASDDGSCGVEWELTYLPQSEGVACNGHTACRTAFRFVGASVDRSTREGLSGVVFLSARSVCLYTGSTDAQGECALDLFTLTHHSSTSDTSRWQRSVAALTLSSNRPRTADHTRSEMRLLHVSAMPSVSAVSHTTNVIYALATPSVSVTNSSSTTLYDIVFGVVAIHYESKTYSVTSQLKHILTDHSVRLVFPPQRRFSVNDTREAAMNGNDDDTVIAPWQCRWLFVPDVRAIHPAEPDKVAGILVGLVDMHELRLHSNDNSHGLRRGHTLRVHCAGFRADEAEPVLGLSAGHRSLHRDALDDASEEEEQEWQDTHNTDQHSRVVFLSIGAPTTRLAANASHSATSEMDKAHTTTQADIHIETSTPQMWVLRLVCDFLQPAQGATGAAMTTALPPVQGLYLTSTSLDQLASQALLAQEGYNNIRMSDSIVTVSNHHTRWCGLLSVQLPSRVMRDHTAGSDMKTLSLTIRSSKVVDGMSPRQQDYTPASPCTPLRLLFVDTCNAKGEAERQSQAVCCCAFATQPAPLTHTATLYIAQLTCATLLQSSSSLTSATEEDTDSEADMLLCRSPCLMMTSPTRNAAEMKEMVEWLARVALRSATSDKAEVVARRVVQLLWQGCLAVAEADVTAAVAIVTQAVQDELPWKTYTAAQATHASLDDYSDTVWGHISTMMASGTKDTLYQWAVHTWHACFLQLMQHVDWLAITAAEQCVLRQLILCYLGLMSLNNNDKDENSEAMWLCMHVLLRVTAHEALGNITSTQDAAALSTGLVNGKETLQWLRRMLLLYASRRCDATLELLLEDLCTTAATAQYISEPHMTHTRAMMEGMEYALLSSVDEATLYDLVHTLARSELPLSDLHTLCCHGHRETLHGVAETTLPTLPLLPFLVNVAHASNVGSEDDDIESMIVQLLSQYEGYYNEKDECDESAECSSSVHPLCLPAFLLRDGVPWTALSRFPFSALSAEACILVFFHVIERWAQYVEVKQATSTIPVDKEEETSVSVSEDVACAVWERYAAQCQRLREAVHVWRWMSSIDIFTVTYEECSPAELLVRGMRMWHLCDKPQCEMEGTHALTDFAVLLHLRPCAFLTDNPIEEDSDDEEDDVVVVQRLMRFVHRVFACATSRLLASLAQRSVTEEVQQDKGVGDASCVVQQEQLAGLYNAAKGLSESAEEEDDEEVKPATAYDVSRRVLCALWEHLWYDDAEAVTNAVLYDKLLETAATLQTKSTSDSIACAASLLMALMRPICLYCYPVLMQTSNNSKSNDADGEEEDRADDMTLYKQYDELTYCVTHNNDDDDDDVPRCSLAEVRVKAMSAVLRSLALFESNGSEANATTAAMSLRCLRRLLALLPATNTDSRAMPHPRSASSVSTAPGSARVSRPPSTAPAATVTTRPTLSPRNTLQVSHHSGRQGTELYGTERIEGNAAAHSTLQGWALSPVASYFVAMHGILSQADMTHMVLVAELLRRELSSFVLRALIQLCYVEGDPNNQLDTVKYVATDCFEPREVLNTVAEGMEGGIDALRTCGGALYEPLVLLLYLERMHSLCVAQSTTSDEVGEQAKVYCEDAMRETLEQCIGIIAQRTLAPLSAEVRHRLHYVLPEHFDAQYCSASEAPATAVSLSEMSYEQSAVHQRMQAEVFATLQDLRSVVLPDGPDAELAHACGLNDVPSENTTQTAARGSADAEAGFVEGGGNFLAHTLLSKLTEHIAPSPQSQALSHTQTTLTNSTGAGVEKTAERERDINLLVKEEAVRRRQVQAATLQAYHAYVTTDRTFLNALATLYLAMRHERRRRELLSHVTEQKDLIFTFSMLWLRQLQEAQRQRGRQLALAAAEALQRQWRLVQREEREQRMAIEALAGAVRSLLVTQHAEQTQVWEREQQTRLALVQLEEQQREWMMSEASTVLPILRPHVSNEPLRVSPTPPYTSLANHNNTNEYDVAAQMSSAGLAYVNEAKDNLWNAFSKLHSKLRDTVAPAPPERARRMPLTSDSNSALPTTTQAVWAQPPPPTSAPAPQTSTSHAGWEWNDEEAEEKSHDSHATEEKLPAEPIAVPPQAPPLPVMADKHEDKEEEDKKTVVPQESSTSASVVPVVRVPHTRPRRTARRAPFATVLDTKAVQEVTEIHAITPPTTTESPIPVTAQEVAEVRTDESGESVYDAIAEAVAAESSLEEASGTLDTHRNEESRCMLPRDVAERCATAETQARAELTAAEAQAWRVVRVDEVYHSALIARRYALTH